MPIHIPSKMLSLVLFQNVDVMKRDQLMENVIQSLDNAFVKSINGVDKDVIYQSVSCNDKLSILQLVNSKFVFLYPNQFPITTTLFWSKICKSNFSCW